jgi:hypothetical protein
MMILTDTRAAAILEWQVTDQGQCARTKAAIAGSIDAGAMTRRKVENASSGRTKAQLPEKTCLACNLPFAWRKKWARDWDGVRYCSDRCRRGKARSRKVVP